MADVRGYSAANFLLELEGKPAGFLVSVEGGEPFAIAVAEPADQSGVIAKTPGPTQFAPLKLTFSAGMSREFYAWVSAMLERKPSSKTGAVIFTDFASNETSRLVFEKALITEVVFPAFDGASKEPAHITVTLRPAATRVTAAGKGAATQIRSAKPKNWLTQNFRFKVSGLETDCARVNRIDSLVVSQANGDGVEKSGALQIPNVRFTIADSAVSGFASWFDDFVVQGNANEKTERSGTVELLDPALKSPMLTLTLSNLGVLRVQKVSSQTGAEVIARSAVELYCERMSMSVSEVSIGSFQAEAAKLPPGAAPPAPAGVNAAVADALLAFIGEQLSGQDAFRTALLTPVTGVARSKLVAQRLLATVQPLDRRSPIPKRDDGAAIGQQWANETATLDELQQLAVLDAGEWTAVRLNSGHSLIAKLADAGVLTSNADGPIDLGRDGFVEGIVMGAALTLRDASPHLAGDETHQ